MVEVHGDRLRYETIDELVFGIFKKRLDEFDLFRE